MDKKFFIALALCFLILVGYPYYLKLASPPKETPSAQEQTGPATREELSRLAAPASVRESSVKKPASTIKAEYFKLSNDRMRVTFSNVCASVVGLESIDTSNGTTKASPVIEVAEGEIGSFALDFGRGLEPQPIVYKLVRQMPGLIEFEGQVLKDLTVHKAYSLIPDKDAMKLRVSFINKAAQQTSADYSLVSRFFIGEKRYGRPLVNAIYYNGEKTAKKGLSSMRKKPFENKEPLNWAGMEEKYFALLIAPSVKIERAVTTTSDNEELIGSISCGTLRLEPGQTVTDEYLLFCGPKYYDELKSFGLGFEKLMHAWVIGNLWVYLLKILIFFYGIFKNYGIAIIALSVLIKILFWPLTHMSFKSMKRMQDLQPKIKAIQEQYKKDPQRMNQEVMQLYKTHKVNPLGGCFPILLQMPIFIALYQALTQAVELHGAPFVWWITDLSKPDHLFTLPFNIPFLGDSFNVLPLLMIISMVWQQKLTPTTTTSKDQKTMMLIMPIVFGFIFYNLPSGLVLYWFINNVLTIGHQLLFNRRPSITAA